MSVASPNHRPVSERSVLTSRWCWSYVCCVVLLAGCGLEQRLHGLHQGGPQPQAVLAQNPLYVPLSDREFLWNQLVDTIDDYFDIEREERVRLVGGVLTEGQLETYPQPGATFLEPVAKDSSVGFQRRFASMQSIRRRAVVHVKPQVDGGYLVDVAVFSELEDVAQPEHSTVNVGGPAHRRALRRPDSERYSSPTTLGWIPVGRDTTLEQRILAEFRGRPGVVAGP